MSAPSQPETKTVTQQEVDHRIEELAKQTSFPPPVGFAPKRSVDVAGLHEHADRDVAGFWAEQARELSWSRPFEQVLDDSKRPFYRWFADGTLNASYNCLDRHVEAGNGDRVAFHWRGDEGEERDLTYSDLLDEVSRFANGLKMLGVAKGDVVGIFLPMIPEVVVAMLACARIGAIHNVVFGGFSPGSVRERMAVSEAKLLVTADGARRRGKSAAVKSEVDAELEGMPTVKTIVVVRATGQDAPMTEGRDYWYDELLAGAAPTCEPEQMQAEAPLFILYSSGSTAKPKGIVHSTGGYLTQVGFTHRLVFDLEPATDVYWCTADVGWITGHSYIVYGPMLNGATSVMFEGAPDYPDKDAWWDIIERYGVTLFYTAPTAIRACMKWGVEYPNRHDLSSLRVLGTVGEPINPKAWLWYFEVIGAGRCPVVDTWWQTETGGIMIAPLPGHTVTKPGSATQPLPGIGVGLLNEDGAEVAEGEGLLVLTQPSPAMLRTLWQDDDRYVDTYFSQFGDQTYVVGDGARRDHDGYFWIIGRTDDVINVSGHRLSTAEVESALDSHDRVAEAACVAQSDEDTGQAILAFVTLTGDAQGGDDLAADLREHVAQKIGKLARPKRIIWAPDLPKTRSGKIMRRLLRDIAEGRDLGDVSTLSDPGVVQQLADQAAAGVKGSS